MGCLLKCRIMKSGKETEGGVGKNKRGICVCEIFFRSRYSGFFFFC